jgi:hypothetical protein
MSHVFVSHSSDNRELANDLAAFLEARGVRIWIAPRDVRPGMDYSEQLQLSIEKAVAFVVLVTDMANKSPYVRAETEMAFSNHKPIFPIRISDIQPAAGLALFLKIRHWTDAFGPSKTANLDRLARELQTLTGAGAEATPPASPAPASPPPIAAQGQAAAGRPLAAAATAVAKPAAPRAPANAEDEEKWRAAVGPKADLYLQRWKDMAQRNSAASWNWAACLANFFWFAYRKMWIPAGAMGAVYLLNVALMSAPDAARVVALLSLGITFLTGLFGTHLYRLQTAKLVAGTAGQPSEAAMETLRTRGGVSQPALYGAIGAVVVLILIAAVVIGQRTPPPVVVGPSDPFNTVSPDPFNTQQGGDKPSDSQELPPEEVYEEGF